MTQTLEPSTAPAFSINDLESLTWYVRKLAAINTEQERVAQQAKRIIHDLELEAEGLGYQFGMQAEQTARRLITERGGRAKHIKTLFGDAGLRRSPPRLSILNKYSAAQWLADHAPDCLDAPQVNFTHLAERFKVASGELVNADGELVDIPGVTVIAERETFYIKAKSEP